MIKEFTLGATKWKVEEVDRLKKDSLGYSSLIETKVLIATNHKKEIVSKGSKQDTLYHEVVHSILDSMGRYKLSQNEHFVQGFAILMRQFEETKK